MRVSASNNFVQFSRSGKSGLFIAALRANALFVERDSA